MGSIRKPAGPSDTTIVGIPKRGIAKVVPAAPGTLSCVVPITGPPGGFIPGILKPLPTSSFTFSSSVIAAITSFTEFLPSCGVCAVATANRLIEIKRDKRFSYFKRVYFY